MSEPDHIVAMLAEHGRDGGVQWLLSLPEDR
jgi:hypothetical protein